MIRKITVGRVEMKRKIISIDESKCNGCEQCLPGCPEGALQMIDGKARLISDLFCDGLGACLGHCPEGAITIEEREAAPYDERQVIAGIARQGKAVIEAHLQHLRDHKETTYLQQALDYLREQGLAVSPGNGGRRLAPGASRFPWLPRVPSHQLRRAAGKRRARPGRGSSRPG